jgi:RNA polymerase sigma factor for flagellar operon FliA
VEGSARNRLIADHAGVARRIALRLARRCPPWIAREDLIAAGMLGLTEAADRYDSSREEPFVAFAEHRIRGAILDELRRGDIMPRRVRQLARKVTAKKEELERSGGVATEQKLADALGVSVDKYRTELAALAHVQIEPLEGEEGLVARETEAPDVVVAQRRELARVRRALVGLEARDCTILRLHFIDELTYQQIASIMKVVTSRVYQLLWRAVGRLRTALVDTGPAACDASRERAWRSYPRTSRSWSSRTTPTSRAPSSAS